MPILFSPWDTRSVTVPGHNSFNTAQHLNGGHYHHQATAGANPPNTYPWRTTSTRVGVADAAKEASSLVSRVFVAQPDMNMTPYPGASTRKDHIDFLVGLKTQTLADRTLFGTYYDDFLVDAWLGEAETAVNTIWLQLVFAQPTTSTTDKALSVPEWDTLWAGPPPGPYSGRQIDLAGCSISLSVTYAVVDASTLTGGSPAFTAKEDPTSAYSGQYRQASIINPLTTVATITGAARTVPWVSPQWTDLSNVPIGYPVIDESQVPSVQQPLYPVGQSSSSPGSLHTEYLSPESIWGDGFDPGYDETGGIPPLIPASQVYLGGDGADWYVTVRASLAVTYTIRQRFYGFTFGTPPLWQRQRIGAIDSPESFASGLVTPQSSPWQGGIL